ncbi:MAG: hypothetical protein QXL86_01255 [Candidatus Aenigmatarchaeota archaeon]
MTQIEEKIEIDKYTEQGCKKGEHFYKPKEVEGKIFYPCDKCPYFLKIEVERSLFGIGGSIGGSIFKQMEDPTRIRRIEKVDLGCRKFNHKKTIEY